MGCCSCCCRDSKRVSPEEEEVNSATVFYSTAAGGETEDKMSSGGAKVLVVMGSVRDGRHGLRVARLFMDYLTKQGLVPTLIDPLEIDAPLLRQPLHFMAPEAQEKAPQWMHKLNSQIQETDGFMIVTPEYNSTAPPALTNLLDHFSPANYRHKPVSIATYSMGPFGASRVRVALLSFVSELGMVALPSTLAIPTVQNAEIDEEGKTENERVLKSVEKMCQELDWYIAAQKTHKDKTGGFPN